MIGAVLVGGSANSSSAAHVRRAAKGNHSTKAISKSRINGARGARIVTGRKVVRVHALPSNRQSLRMALAQRTTHKATVHAAAAKHHEKLTHVAQTPRRVWVKKQNTRKSNGHQQGGSPEELAMREALARREAWTDPREPLTQPAKVQDPPASSETAHADREGVQMASQPNELNSPNDDLIREALRNRGAKYVWGGASRGAFDCSGFICYIFARQRHMKLPHSASAQARLGTPVSNENLQPGDLVFFSTYRPGISHVGLYIGDNRFIHAANRRLDVRIDHLTGYYARRIRAARRLTSTPIRFTPRDLQDYLREPSETPQSGG